MKTVFKVLLSAAGLLTASSVGGYFYMRQRFEPKPNQLALSALPTTSPFAWLPDTANNKVMPHAAMLVPVSVPGCPRTCYFQFDTGAPSSLLYAKSVAALQARYPATVRSLPLQGDTVHNAQFGLGRAQLQVRRFRVLGGGMAPVPADNSAKPFILGTLGADVLDGRVLVIDYVRQRFDLYAQLPDSLARRAAFVPLAFTSRRVLLTAGLQGKSEQLLFDSGSSAFALLTSQAIWKTLALPAAPTQVAPVNSMGRTLTTYTVATGAALQLGTQRVPLRTVTYIEGTSLMESLLMRFSGMGGMLGNEPFSQQTVILDAAGQRFGIIPSRAGLPLTQTRSAAL